MHTAKYIIPNTPPSLNKFAGRENVWEYREQKELWKNYCVVYCRPRPKRPPEYAQVTLTFYFGNRIRHDADNYQKFLLDGLVAAGVIKDDDFNHVQVLCKGGYDKKKPRVEIEVKEMDYTSYTSMIENIIIERNKNVDSAIMGEIQQIAVEYGIDTKITINEKNVADALRKHTPQKVNISLKGTTDFNTKCNCPMCRKIVFDGQKYCSNCGQALDWGEKGK